MEEQKIDVEHYEYFILDGSVLTSQKHCDVLLSAKEKFYVSQKLYTMMFEENNRDRVLLVLNHFSQRKIYNLPKNHIKLKEYLIPYSHKEHLNSNALLLFKKAELDTEVLEILADELTFLSEHSFILMTNNKFGKYLYKLGVPIFDAKNKYFEWKDKNKKLIRVRRARWLIGFFGNVGKIGVAITQDIYSAIMAAVGEVILFVFDP